MTNEMSKFLDLQDEESLFEMVEQRDNLQKIIEEHQDKEFVKSGQGIQLLTAIQRENASIMVKFNYLFNKYKQHQQVNKAYTANEQITAGSFFSSQG